MNRTIKIIGIIFLIGSFAPAGFAQNSIKSLEECVRFALENNLTLQSGRISIEKAKDLQGTALNIDRTSISLSQDPTTGGGADNSIALSQGLDFPSVYLARHKLLKAETNLERNYFDLTKNELIKEVTKTYYELLYARKCKELLTEQDSVYSQFFFLATARFKAGETNQLEQINAERLYNENKMELLSAEKEFQTIQMEMQTWLNTEEWIEPQENDLPVMDMHFLPSELAVQQSPLAQIYKGKLAVSEENSRLQQQQFLPGFDFSLRNQLLIKGFNPYHINRERFDKGNFMGFEVGMRFPLFFGEQRSKAKAAKKEVEIAKLQHQTVLQSLKKELNTYLNQFRKNQTRLDYYQNVGLAKAGEMTRISQLAYEKGEINYIEYIQNLKTAIEIKLQYANAVKEYNQTVIEINYIQIK
jgi:cobalt-zinc-cadmium resistance protein CzcA